MRVPDAATSRPAGAPRARDLPRGVLPALAAALLVACAPRRTLVVDSEPRGALVRLDDETIGTTRLEHRFYHYGVRQVTLYKDGYGTFSERIELRAPWYSRFPLDFLTEVLLPVGLEDRRKLKVKLVPGEEEVSLPTLRSVFERADILRRAGPDGPRNLPPPRVRALERVEEEPPEPPAPSSASSASPEGETRSGPPDAEKP